MGRERTQCGEAATESEMEKAGNDVRGMFVKGMGKGFEEYSLDEHSSDFPAQEAFSEKSGPKNLRGNARFRWIAAQRTQKKKFPSLRSLRSFAAVFFNEGARASSHSYFIRG
jgi:hypothetical protein